MSDQPTCESCRWFSRAHGPMGRNFPMEGWCRRNAPANETVSGRTIWPRVFGSEDWCGLHEVEA